MFIGPEVPYLVADGGHLPLPVLLMDAQAVSAEFCFNPIRTAIGKRDHPVSNPPAAWRSKFHT